MATLTLAIWLQIDPTFGPASHSDNQTMAVEIPDFVAHSSYRVASELLFEPRFWELQKQTYNLCVLVMWKCLECCPEGFPKSAELKKDF